MGELVIPQINEISEVERNEIDLVVEQAIAKHKENTGAMNRLTFNCVTAITATEARSRELEEQGFWKRTWKTLTGGNQKLQNAINGEVAQVQYASQQMMNKLAEQNLLTIDLITVINNKMNTLLLHNDEEFNQVYKVLDSFIAETKSNIVQLEQKVDKLERTSNLLKWNKIVEYEMFGGVEYRNLPMFEKLVCLSNDFYRQTQGSWSTKDLMLLKKTLSELGLQDNISISLREFYLRLIENLALVDRLFEDISLDAVQALEPYEVPLLKGVEKVHKVCGEEQYIVKTMTTHMEAMGVPYEKRELQLLLISNYLMQTAYLDTQAESKSIRSCSRAFG